MLKVLGNYILVKALDKPKEEIIARPKDNKITRGIVLMMGEEVLNIAQGDLVHFPMHTPQKIEHDGEDELYVIKIEDVLLLSRKHLDPKSEKGKK